jgi:hypothetical protein
MNDKVTFALSSVLAIALAVWSVFAKPEGLGLLVTVQLVVIIVLAVIFFLIYRSKKRLQDKLGLVKVYDRRRTATDKEYDFISSANRSLIFVGIMHRSLWNYREDLEKALLSTAARNVEVKFYLSAPDSEELKKRAEDEGDLQGDWTDQIRLQISRFRHLKERYPTLNLSVFTYKEYPAWHIILRDESRVLVGWYPVGRTGYDAPLLEMTCESQSTLFAPVERWLRSLERNAVRVL